MMCVTVGRGRKLQTLEKIFVLKEGECIIAIGRSTIISLPQNMKRRFVTPDKREGLEIARRVEHYLYGYTSSVLALHNCRVGRWGEVHIIGLDQ